MNDDGNFIISWNGEGTEDTLGVYAQRYNKDGGKNGSEFKINTYTKDNQDFPSIAMNNNGDFVATWSGWGSSKYGIYAKMFDANGNAKKNLDKNKLN